MRVAALFFLFFSFCFLARHNQAQATATLSKSFSHPVQHLEKALEESSLTTRDLLISQNNGLGVENDVLVSVEDDSDEELATKKSVLIKDLSTFLYAFFCGNLFHHIAEPVSFGLPGNIGSPKYIVQRVLRI